MNYKIYCAHTKDRDIFDMTCSPAADLAYYKNLYGINRIEIITQDIDISQALYIIRNSDSNYSPVQRILFRGSKKTEALKLQSIVKSMAQLGLKPLRKPVIVDCASELPGEDSLSFVQEILKGRILSLSEVHSIINKKGMFLKEDTQDILQVLYISHRIEVMPFVMIDKPERRYTCTKCCREISYSELYDDSKCSGCGGYIQVDEPVFACCSNDKEPSRTPVKFKEYKGLSFPQDRGSIDLCTFLKGGIAECLLWMVPGSEDANITSRAVREVLNKGGRCAAAVSCHSEGAEYLRCIKGTFSNINCEFSQGMAASGNEDVVITGMEDIKRYYKAFDLIILSEASECTNKAVSCLDAHVKRALKDGGKIIYATSKPDYKTYKRVLKGEVSLVAVPLRSHGRLCPEPRIMTYKALSYDNLFIPSEVMEYITWSAGENVRVHVIVPYEELIEQVRGLLLNCDGIKDVWLSGKNPIILITTSLPGHIHVGEEENIIVFFADESKAFDEKTLISLAGLSGRSNSRASGEVLFVGSGESDEMYNARHMMRYINKAAWEMGYVK